MPKNYIVNHSPSFTILGALAVIICGSLVVLSACNHQDPVQPGIPNITTSTIIMATDPDSLQAPWTLTGPADFQRLGNGGETFTDVEPGSYTAQWSTITCWSGNAASDTTATVAAGDTITFHTHYLARHDECGSLTISITFPEPAYNPIPVFWALTGPNRYSLYGEGNQTLELVPWGTTPLYSNYLLAFCSRPSFTPLRSEKMKPAP